MSGSAAVLLVTAFALPWAMGVVALAHNADGHHDHALDHQLTTESLELAVHGHHHEHGTPSHQHTFTLAKLAPLGVRVSLSLDSTTIEPSTHSIPQGGRYSSIPCADVAHGPPTDSRNIQVLRI